MPKYVVQIQVLQQKLEAALILLGLNIPLDHALPANPKVVPVLEASQFGLAHFIFNQPVILFDNFRLKLFVADLVAKLFDHLAVLHRGVAVVHHDFVDVYGAEVYVRGILRFLECFHVVLGQVELLHGLFA